MPEKPETPNPVRRARRLRQAANLPERRAWQALRGLRAEGWPVRRQHPIGPYTADFAIMRARLVIEIDGGSHRIPGRRAQDQERDRALDQLGWQVLRVPADVALDGDMLIERVRAVLPDA